MRLVTGEKITLGENSQYHFFASCALGWATADTRKDAVIKCADQFRYDLTRALKSLNKKGELGPYLWSCKVLAPKDAKYSIEYYQPKGISIGAGVHHHITYITQKSMAFFSSEVEAKPLQVD